jgi:cytosine/adenosine deaminase-related metal-dependent hydrolase
MPRPGAWLDGGGVLIDGGRVVRTLSSPRAVARAAAAAGGRALDLGDAILTPGLVNAHAHHELTGLEGRVPRGAPFGAWIGAVLRQRARRGPTRLARDAECCGQTAPSAGTPCPRSPSAISSARSMELFRTRRTSALRSAGVFTFRMTV